VLSEILPPAVAVAEAFDDPPDVVLDPQEEALIVNAVAKRRLEFGTVRWCARRALTELGMPPSPILPGVRGAPRWPAGVVGSLTHCAGYRAAALAHAREIMAIGVDAEPHDPLPEGVGDAIARPEELTALTSLTAAAPQVCWDRLLFSAKESVYKAWFPLTQRWLDFEEASISFDPAEGTFSAQLLVPAPPPALQDGLKGRWLARNGLLLTAIAVPAAR
jgi:4'-phosphopantetheinyl transferase EntD